MLINNVSFFIVEPLEQFEIIKFDLFCCFSYSAFENLLLELFDEWFSVLDIILDVIVDILYNLGDILFVIWKALSFFFNNYIFDIKEYLNPELPTLNNSDTFTSLDVQQIMLNPEPFLIFMKYLTAHIIFIEHQFLIDCAEFFLLEFMPEPYLYCCDFSENLFSSLDESLFRFMILDIAFFCLYSDKLTNYEEVIFLFSLLINFEESSFKETIVIIQDFWTYITSYAMLFEYAQNIYYPLSTELFSNLLEIYYNILNLAVEETDFLSNYNWTFRILPISEGFICINTFYNSTFFSFLLLLLTILFLFLPITNNLYIVPKNWQIIFENLYNFICDMLFAQVGAQAKRFFPYIFLIFLFILVSNILGLALFSFTLTSHLMVTFTLGVSTFLGLTILGFVIQKLQFLKLFFPQGIPTILLPMLIIIEIISYCSRALSLSIRLFANLMSGHTLLHILAFFSSKLFKYKFLVGLCSFVLILVIVCLEFSIALLQAYVFVILICIYLNDSFQIAH